MMKSPVPGWTDARFKNWIISLLRKGTMRFPNRTAALNKAKRGKRINKKTGRLAEHYGCLLCDDINPLKGMHVDHNPPVINPEKGFENFDVYIERMFAAPEVWRVLCKPCHLVLTSKERVIRDELRRQRKKKHV